MRSHNRGLFENNPDVDIIIRVKIPIFAPVMIHGLNFFQLTYPYYPTPLKEQVLVHLCRSAGITGKIALRPYIFLNPTEIAAGRLFERQIVMQTSCMGAAIPSLNKEWFDDRFRAVCDNLKDRYSIIQLGAKSDPPASGALDLRGKTNLRQSAAILSQSLVFIGLEGFLMHLARAVDCRAVIIYGGRLRPSHFGYIAFKNLLGLTTCSPCWLDNTCDYDRECMKMISIESVVNAAMEQIELFGQPLDTETVFI